MRNIDNSQKIESPTNMLYFMWNAWKETSRRIFSGTRMAYIDVAHLIFEDITKRVVALLSSVNLVQDQFTHVGFV